MFLKAGSKTLIMSVFFMSMCLAAGFAQAREQLPGLQQQPYKLKLLTKDFKNKKTPSRSGRTEFCGETISPKLRKEEGKLILEVSPGIGFEWRSINENPTDVSDGCRYSTVQTVESSADRSRLMLINGEECKRGKTVVGSQRDTLYLSGQEIIYQVESVVKDAAGIWQNLESKEGFTCIWTLSRVE